MTYKGISIHNLALHKNAMVDLMQYDRPSNVDYKMIKGLKTFYEI